MIAGLKGTSQLMLFISLFLHMHLECFLHYAIEEDFEEFLMNKGGSAADWVGLNVSMATV
jgi:hypothetical protein